MSGHDSDEGADEELDPRVEGALGDLNKATDDINVSETSLDDAKKAFKERHSAMQADLGVLHSKCGKKAIERARPYHEALFKARKAHYEARQAALQFERAAMMQKRSKTLEVQYEGQLATGDVGAGKADVERKLKNASKSVDEAEERKKKASKLHGVKTQAFLVADQTLMEYAKTRKRSILKSQPYFACKERHDRGLLAVKRDIQKHEAGVKDAKARVAAALKLLETISEEIHQARQKKKVVAAASPAASPTPPVPASPEQENQAALVAKKIAEVQADTARRESEAAARKAQEDDEMDGEKDGLFTDPDGERGGGGGGGGGGAAAAAGGAAADVDDTDAAAAAAVGGSSQARNADTEDEDDNAEEAPARNGGNGSAAIAATAGGAAAPVGGTVEVVVPSDTLAAEGHVGVESAAELPGLGSYDYGEAAAALAVDLEHESAAGVANSCVSAGVEGSENEDDGGDEYIDRVGGGSGSGENTLAAGAQSDTAHDDVAAAENAVVAPENGATEESC